MDAHKNFAYSTITTAPSPAASGTSLTVAAGGGALFPAVPFNATVWPIGALPLATNGEIVRVTAIVGDVLTITRAQESSSARTIIVGDQIAATITNKTLTDIETAIPSTAGLLSAINVSAGATSNNLSAVTFSNSNGISFGLTGSVITGTVATNYQSQGAYLTTAQPVGAYLTTAGLSGDSSKYAGTNGAITGGSITVNTSGVSVNLPAYLTTAQSPGAYLTTAMQSNAVTLSNAKFSAGTLSALRSDLTFADSNGVSFGLNTNGVITATVAAAAGGLTNIKVSAGTLSALRSDLTFSNSNGVSFGLETNGVVTGTVATNYQSQGAYLTTAALSQDSSQYAGTNGAITGGSITVNTSGVSVSLPAYLTTAQSPGAYLTTAMQSNAATISNVNLSAGTTSNNLSAFVFSNSNGVSFGLNGSTVTANAALAMLSYYNVCERIVNTTTSVLSSNSIYVQPFNLPQNISASFIRVPVTMSAIASTYAGTTADATNTLKRGQTDAFVIYSQGVGASSLSLQYVTSGSAGWTFQTKIQAGTAGSQNTVSLDITYPSLGANTQAYATSYGISTSNYLISTESHSLFTGPRVIDIPFAASLSAGNYWIGFGRSTSSATQVAGHGPGISASLGFSTVGITQVNSTFGYPGAVVAASNQIQPGLGMYTNAAALFSTSSIGLAEISATNSLPLFPFQFIRRV